VLGWQDVTDVYRVTLQECLVGNYANLSGRLARRLGSADAADEALQETYLRLETASISSAVSNPISYLVKIALNIATDKRRAEARRLTTNEVDALLDIADDNPDPARIVEARSEIIALEQALKEMPERRRAIFKAVLIENIPRRELAEHFGVSVRTIDIEVQRALEQGARHLENWPSTGSTGSSVQS
jgi:RNA polymerase sigma-70 factor, ECF subfamily